MNLNPDENPNAKEIMRGVNEFRNSLIKRNGVFSKDEFLKGLKDLGLPSNVHFWSALRTCKCSEIGGPLITKVGQDKFVFTDPKKPIFWGDLQAVYNSYKSLLEKYKKTQKQKKTAVKEESKALSDEIAKAIELLKSNGFEVLAPVAILYAKVQRN